MAKYEVGDKVLYGLSGACEVICIGTLDFGGPDKIYYSLKPVSDSRSTIYVPVTKEQEIKRKVISVKEANAVLDNLGNVKPSKLNAVHEECDPVIKSGDNLQIASLIKQLRELRRENRKNHKGLNIQEERILRNAEMVFYSEISTALGMSYEDIVNQYNEELD